MLTAMLRYMVNSKSCLVSTRSNGISLFPKLALIMLLLQLKIAELIFLDATDTFLLNILPLGLKLGRLIRKDGSSTEVDLMQKTIS
jgi:hypothetical protein